MKNLARGDTDWNPERFLCSKRVKLGQRKKDFDFYLRNVSLFLIILDIFSIKIRLLFSISMKRSIYKALILIKKRKLTFLQKNPFRFKIKMCKLRRRLIIKPSCRSINPIAMLRLHLNIPSPGKVFV